MIQEKMRINKIDNMVGSLEKLEDKTKTFGKVWKGESI